MGVDIIFPLDLYAPHNVKPFTKDSLVFNKMAREKSGSDMPTNVEELKALMAGWGEQIMLWAQSPAFLAQVGVIVGAFFLAPIIAGILRKSVPYLKNPPAETQKLKAIFDVIYRSRVFLRPIVLVVLLALGAAALKAVASLGQDWLVKLAQGLAVVFLVYRLIKHFITNALFQKIALWTVLPVSVLMVFGYYDDLIAKLDTTKILDLGQTPVTALTLVKLIVFGGIIFWVGGRSNARGQKAIRQQETLDASTREVVAKIFQMLLFAILFILLLSFAGIPLSGLVVIFSALTLGIGLGLQPVAANFVSGLIILFDRTVQIGDYVELPDGQQGFVEAINMRSTTVETTDGKDIMVPNTKFIEEAYRNWTHKDPSQRFEVYFTVTYDTDIDKLEDILIPMVLTHPSVLKEPEMPDLELREFGENGINFAIEFWCNGIDDGPNKFTSDLNFMVWRTLKKHGIEMPLPQREVRMLK